jgi:hypothetical protein
MYFSTLAAESWITNRARGLTCSAETADATSTAELLALCK